MRTTLLALFATAALASGCSSSDGGDSPTEEPPSAEPTSNVTPNATYSTVEDLRDAAIESGYDCPNWKQRNQVDLAAESGSCSNADVFSTYASSGDLQSQVETTREINQLFEEQDLGPGDPQLVGPNWIINGQGVEDLADALGGTIQR